MGPEASGVLLAANICWPGFREGPGEKLGEKTRICRGVRFGVVPDAMEEPSLSILHL